MTSDTGACRSCTWQGVPWARIGEAVGHDDITTTSRVYRHVLADEAELDYEALLTR
jgi:integrase